MNDFRIDFVKSVANKLGWDQTSEDLDKGEIRYGENTVISFREKDYLNINIYIGKFHMLFQMCINRFVNLLILMLHM